MDRDDRSLNIDFAMQQPEGRWESQILRVSIDSRQPVPYRSFVLSWAPRSGLHDPRESFKLGLRIRTAAGIFQRSLYLGHLHACVIICFIIPRLGYTSLGSFRHVCLRATFTFSADALKSRVISNSNSLPWTFLQHQCNSPVIGKVYVPFIGIL